jgi:hypothetical protein
MNWNRRYAIAAWNENPDGLTEVAREQLKNLGAVLNKQHLKFNQVRKYNEDYTTLKPEDGWKTIQSDGKNHVAIRPSRMRKEFLQPGDQGWDAAVKDFSGFDGLVPTSESKVAHEAISKFVDTNGSPKPDGGWEMPKPLHPEVKRTLGAIRQEVGSASGWGGSTSELGGAGDYGRALHHTIINAPTESVPELHRGISFRFPTDGFSGSKSAVPDLVKGVENREINRQAILERFKPGTVLPERISSWSADPDIARGFAFRGGQSDANGGSIQAVLHLPPQSQALQISGLHPSSAFQEEYLGASGHLEVTKHTVDEEGVHHIHVKQKSLDDNYTPPDTGGSGWADLSKPPWEQTPSWDQFRSSDVEKINKTVEYRSKNFKYELGREQQWLEETGKKIAPVAEKAIEDVARVARKLDWDTRYRLAALSDDYITLFNKFKDEAYPVLAKPGDPAREAFKAYTSVPLKNGQVPNLSFWDNFDATAPNGVRTTNRPELLNHEALIRVCDEWSKKLAQATGGDANQGKSYYWPMANHMAELKDWHMTQFKPQLDKKVFTPPSYREQMTRGRRNK